MKSRTIAVIVALALLAWPSALGEGYRIANENQMNFGELLVDLMHAYERPAPGDGEAIEAELAAIDAVDARDGEIARSIANHWNRVYVNADGTYRLYLYGGGDRATELEESGLRDSPDHAFVVLGYELKTAVGTSVFIMTFTALTGAVSHFAFGGAPDLLVLILCVVFTLLWARIAAVLANKSSPKVLNRVTGIILTVLGVVILGVNFFFS